VINLATLCKEFSQSSSATSGITAYSLEGQRKKRAALLARGGTKKLYPFLGKASTPGATSGLENLPAGFDPLWKRQFDYASLCECGACSLTKASDPPSKKYVLAREQEAASRIASVLSLWGRKFSLIIARVGKAERSTESIVQGVMDELDLDGFSTAMAETIRADLRAAFKAGGLQAVQSAALDVSTELADARASEFAAYRSAELVGMSRAADGTFVPNPNAEMSITETTRTALKDLTTAAVQQGWSAKDLRDAIESSGTFSDVRAMTIARTELANSYVGGQIDSYRASGVVTHKESLLADTHPQIDECDDAADAGIIEFEAPFPTDDDDFAPPYHPNCLCALVGYTDEEMGGEKMAKAFDPDQPRDEAGRWAATGAISVRKPTGVTDKEDSFNNKLNSSIEDMARDPKKFEKNIALMESYSGLRAAPPGSTLMERAAFLRDQIAANVRASYDALATHGEHGPEMAALAANWYPGAHELAAEDAQRYGLTVQQTSGIYAALSPKFPWPQNIAIAKSIMDTAHEHGDEKWDPEMATWAHEIYGQTEYASLLPSMEGKSYNELSSDEQRMIYLRTYSETKTDRTFFEYDPHGDPVGLAMTGDRPALLQWPFPNSVLNAVSIMNDGSRHNIDEQLGVQPKVRSFYNDILDPVHSDAVTIDTHAVAAGLFQPLSGNSAEVEHSMGGTGSASSAIFGTIGTNGVYADAYRQAAKELGLRGNQLQSVAWEGVRGIYGASFKTTTLKSPARTEAFYSIWKDYKHGLIDQHTAQQRSLAIANGFTPPRWWRRDNQDDAGKAFALDARDVRSLVHHSGAVRRGAGAGSADLRGLIKIGLRPDGGWLLIEDPHAYGPPTEKTLLSRLIKEFSEEQHPRDDHGRFATTSGLSQDESLMGRMMSSMRDEHGNMKPGAGFTIDARTRDDVKEGYSVGAFPSRSLEMDAAALTPEQMRASIKDWIQANQSKLADPRVKIGGWVDPETMHVWLDAARVYGSSEKDLATAVGTRLNQKAIANLGAIARGDWEHAFINTFGTGAAKMEVNAMGKRVLIFLDGDATAEEILAAIQDYLHPAAKGDIDDAASAAALHPMNPLDRPSTAQLKVGNYAMGHVNIGGLYISIENPAGSHRGSWGQPMAAHYGYIKTTEGADGDHVDVFVKPGTNTDYSGPVFVIDQFVDGKFDEVKCMIGWKDEAAARDAYQSSYQPGWDGLQHISMLTLAQFKHWLLQGDTTKPYQEN
jgi:hypothetical protein